MGISKWAANSMMKLILILVICFAGLGLPLGMASVYLELYGEGLFSTWKLLGETKGFIRIVDANSQGVLAETDSGERYFWNSNCRIEIECNVWLATEVLSSNLQLRGGEMPIKRSSDCQGFKYQRTPPGTLIECVKAQYLGPESGTSVFYALNNDGDIWVWSFSTSLPQQIGVVFLSIVIGLLFVIVILFVYLTKWRRESG